MIIGTGHYLPERTIHNTDFLKNEFFTDARVKYPAENEVIIEKFKEITRIEERRYLRPDWNNSDMGTIAARRALDDSNIDPETLDYIICATNFGEVTATNPRSNFMPSLAARIKHNLRIKNPKTVAYDMVFGCPGWVESMIQAEAFIQAGLAKRVLVVGSETLSRVVDVYDRDAMIFADGAGAVVVEGIETDENIGMLSHNTLSYTYNEAHYLYNGPSYNPEENQEDLFIKMEGRKIYGFALANVPGAIQSTLEDAGLVLDDISKILIHQANEKMDKAIIARLLRLYGIRLKEKAENAAIKAIMPMTISKFGNSSVATIPTMLDLILKEQLGDHQLKKGDTVVMTSVGAGMHINAFVYRF